MKAKLEKLEGQDTKSGAGFSKILLLAKAHQQKAKEYHQKHLTQCSTNIKEIEESIKGQTAEDVKEGTRLMEKDYKRKYVKGPNAGQTVDKDDVLNPAYAKWGKLTGKVKTVKAIPAGLIPNGKGKKVKKGKIGKDLADALSGTH